MYDVPTRVLSANGKSAVIPDMVDHKQYIYVCSRYHISSVFFLMGQDREVAAMLLDKYSDMTLLG